MQAWFDQYASRIASKIREHGWFIQFVGDSGDEPPPTFAYTVGLFGLGHPELVVTGVDTGTNVVHLNDSGTPNGRNEQIPLATFSRAWATSDDLLIVTRETGR